MRLCDSQQTIINLAKEIYRLVGENNLELIKLEKEKNPQIFSDAVNMAHDNVVPTHALHLAAFKGYHQVLRCLLLSGACAHRATSRGFNALHYAMGAGHIKCVRELLCHRQAETDFSLMCTQQANVNNLCKTPMFWALHGLQCSSDVGRATLVCMELMLYALLYKKGVSVEKILQIKLKNYSGTETFIHEEIEKKVHDSSSHCRLLFINFRNMIAQSRYIKTYWESDKDVGIINEKSDLKGFLYSVLPLLGIKDACSVLIATCWRRLPVSDKTEAVSASASQKLNVVIHASCLYDLYLLRC